MIKALFLIFEPLAAWNRIAESRRGSGFIFAFYLLPMMLIVLGAEGYSLVKWGRPQSGTGTMKFFSVNEAVSWETVQFLFLLLVIAICAHFVRLLCDTFNRGHAYTQGFAVVVYGLGPYFLLRLFNMFPGVNPWLTWLFGVMLCVKILYHGVPRVMQPDPPHAFGLFLMTSLILIMATGIERFVASAYLAGRIRPVSDIIQSLAHHRPF
jgi:hypothetical protein